MATSTLCKLFYRRLAAVCAAGVVVCGVRAQVSAPASASPPDKSGFTLFDPTPRELMREMSTDRPDTTESPYTVDAGHVQIELSFVDSALDRRSEDGSRTRALAVAPMLFKVGLTNAIDLQIGVDPFTRQTVTEPGGARETVEGFGDTVVRLKVNVFGNDEEGVALAVMPYIKLPTADDGLGNGDVEGGLIVPVAISLPAGFDLGVMAQLDFRRTDADDAETVDFLHTVTIGHDLPLGFGGYVEYAGFASIDDAESYRAYFDAGLTLGITDDLQFDGGVRIGLNRAADDLAVFLGVSVRF